jgi:hypothetical protein
LEFVVAEFEHITRIQSADERHALEIMRGSSGQYRFIEFEWVLSVDDVDRLVHGDGYWKTSSPSGLYESAQAAEADARASLPWLKENIE